MMGKTKRILAMVMAVALFAVMLSSALFLAEEANHDCIGDGCQICLQLNLCRGVLKSLSLALHAALAPLPFPIFCGAISGPARDPTVMLPWSL